MYRYEGTLEREIKTQVQSFFLFSDHPFLVSEMEHNHAHNFKKQTVFVHASVETL
jgi:hypothetical protein